MTRDGFRKLLTAIHRNKKSVRSLSRLITPPSVADGSGVFDAPSFPRRRRIEGAIRIRTCDLALRVMRANRNLTPFQRREIQLRLFPFLNQVAASMYPESADRFVVLFCADSVEHIISGGSNHEVKEVSSAPKEVGFRPRTSEMAARFNMEQAQHSTGGF